MAREHEDIILLGNLIETIDAHGVLVAAKLNEDTAAGSQAIRNFFRENSRDAMDYIFLLGLCDKILEENQRNQFAIGPAVGNFRELWSRWSSRLGHWDRGIHHATIGLQIFELAEAASHRWQRLEIQDLFEPPRHS
jgi:hypothetical protein